MVPGQIQQETLAKNPTSKTRDHQRSNENPIEESIIPDSVKRVGRIHQKIKIMPNQVHQPMIAQNRIHYPQNK